MENKVYENDGYIMLLDAFFFNGVRIGNVSDSGIDWGGDAAEYIKLYAAQVRNAPVKKIRKKGATNVLSFTLIELLPENCRTVMGGEVNGTKWDYPADDVTLEGPAKILAGTGQTIEIKRVALDGVIRGQLGGDNPLGIDCEMEVMAADDGGSPLSIDETAPFISTTTPELSFAKEGESKTVGMEASGPFKAGAAPAGFKVAIRNGRITVTAEANTGAARTGELTFTLAADPTKKATVKLTQAGS